jgi:hypothetical protein
MPLAFIQGRLVHFAHVPRSAGTAVENYLHARFGRLAFLDRQFNTQEAADRWSKSSPQHVESAAFDRIIPHTWIAHSFAVLRHPEDRIVSVFRFQRDVEQTISQDMPLADWLADLEPLLAQRPHAHDNHARPASDLVPQDAVLFRLEDGLSSLVEWLDDIEGARRGQREIARANDVRDILAFLGRSAGPEPEVTPEARQAIARIYAADFLRFGYEPRTDEEPRTNSEART